MKSPLEVLKHHEQKHEKSCVSWGFEYILKLHDKINIDDYPIQTEYPSGLGFGKEAADLLSPYGIRKDDKYFDLESFKATMLAEAQAGRPPIFSLPTGILQNTLNGLKDIVFPHVFVAFLHNQQVVYLFRQFGQLSNVPPQIPDIDKTYSLLTEVKGNYLIHCLLYTLE